MRAPIVWAIVFLAIASAFSLRHKYLESSALYYHLRAEGMKYPREQPDLHDFRAAQDNYFQRGQHALFWAATCLVLGALGLAGAFVSFAWLRAV